MGFTMFKTLSFLDVSNACGIEVVATATAPIPHITEEWHTLEGAHYYATELVRRGHCPKVVVRSSGIIKKKDLLVMLGNVRDSKVGAL